MARRATGDLGRDRFRSLAQDGRIVGARLRADVTDRAGFFGLACCTPCASHAGVVVMAHRCGNVSGIDSRGTAQTDVPLTATNSSTKHRIRRFSEVIVALDIELRLVRDARGLSAAGDTIVFAEHDDGRSVRGRRSRVDPGERLDFRLEETGPHGK